MEKVKIINPKGTIWCSIEVAEEISKLIEPESRGQLANMLPQRPEVLLSQIEKGLTLLAVFEEKVVGHVTLWEYDTPGYGEIGSLIVKPSFRDRGIGKLLVKSLLESFSNPQIITATVKTEPARCVFEANDFRIIPFDELRKTSESAWRECCPCYFPPEACPKRDKECRLLIIKKKEYKRWILIRNSKENKKEVQDVNVR